ncbi:MAG: DUF4337 domain-containing protein [Rhizobacter sp.]|nr:DUF4337 domain-containing protein [Bacteriovorax sp.]
MEEIEVPLESSQEHIHGHAHHEGGWVAKVALSTALIAVIAAIAALMAGHHSNEALISQIQSSDSWSHYQSKSIKATIVNMKNDILQEMGKPAKAEDLEKSGEYKKEQAEIAEKAKEKSEESELHLRAHVTLAKAVTLFQISIAISAIAVLTRRKPFWYVSLGFAGFGVYFFLFGWLFIK